MKELVITNVRKAVEIKNLQSMVVKDEFMRDSKKCNRLLYIRHTNTYLASFKNHRGYKKEQDCILGIEDAMILGSKFYDIMEQKPDGTYNDEALGVYKPLNTNSLNLYLSFNDNEYCIDMSKVFKDTLGITFMRVNRNFANIHLASLLGISWCKNNDGKPVIRLAFSNKVGTSRKKEEYIQYTYVYIELDLKREPIVTYYKVARSDKDKGIDSDFKRYMTKVEGDESFVYITPYNSAHIDNANWVALENMVSYYRR